MYIDDDGILRVTLFEGANVDLENIKENYKTYKSLLGERKALLLIDSRVKYTFTKEARKYAAGSEMILDRMATAFVVNSFANKLIANIYIKFYKPVVPTKMFSSEESALRWLRSFYVLPGDKFVKPKKR